MKRFIVAGLLTALMLFPMFGYVYLCGRADGIAAYKVSRQFHKTLYSMYMFGMKDACDMPGLCDALLKGVQ